MRKRAASVFVLLILAFACSKKGVENANPYQTIEREDVQLTTKQTVCVEYGNALALNYFKLMYELNGADGKRSFFVSPLGLELLFGLFNAGASGDAADEIPAVMGLGQGETEQLNEYLSSLSEQLLKLDPLSRIRISNIGFINKDLFDLKQPYSEDAARYYCAPVTSEDFSQSEELTERINGWCNEKTEGAIPRIIDQVNPQGFFYMFNAVYFNGAWTSKFDARKTKEEDFYLGNGTAKVKMMKQESRLGYAMTEDYKMLCLPYGNEAFRMNIILPHENKNMGEIVSSLDQDSWKISLSRMFLQPVDVWLPRFETENYYGNLNDQIKALGLGSVFLPGNMDDMAEGIAAEYIIQSTHIKVTEEGTEAAAVTGNVSYTSNMSEGNAVPVEFHANRPFVYFITEYSTGAILFAGQYAGE